ncbi:MAG TPA: hypothetical protein VL200_18110 [Lacunisphaera sp.]|nr:hypothetical protein [Lacunisphaera sp.]
MRRKVSIACLLFAWICANGAIWNVVQVVAWANMLERNVQTMPISRALEVTFDGSAPCALCHLSQKAKDAAREQLPRDAALGDAMDKLLLLADSAPGLGLTPPVDAWPEAPAATGLRRVEAVPVPPPRA